MKAMIIVWIVLLTCGKFVIEGKLPKKIVHGKRALIVEYPYHVSLVYQGHFMCSGSIISTTIILTTASCVSFELNVLAGNLRVVSGTDDRLDDSRGYIHNVRFVMVHKDYKPFSFWKNDISILKLESPIMFSHVQSEIQLPEKLVRCRTTVMVVGWGNSRILIDGTATIYQDFSYERSSRYLNLLKLQVVDLHTCWDLFRKYSSVHDSQRCAITAIENGALTWGDSGGSLFNSHLIMHGIVSILANQQGSDLVIYTRVQNFMKWINEIRSKYE